MKIVIDIPDETYEYVKQNYRYGIGAEVACKLGFAVAEGTLLTDNATNGDVIKILFPYGSYGTNGNEVHVFGIGGNGILVFTKDWWNAPYKAGDTDESDAEFMCKTMSKTVNKSIADNNFIGGF